MTYSVSGPQTWKTKDGRTLKDVENSETAEEKNKDEVYRKLTPKFNAFQKNICYSKNLSKIVFGREEIFTGCAEYHGV